MLGFDPVTDFAIEFARLERDALIRVRAKMAAQQLGECFGDRRDLDSALRGSDRRAA